ncbi:MAG TPA: UDP-N-acetylmuramoyl-L-alanyl-D-glutamate--2,6-diaminopimelate ligase [Thermodesulfobacteriota bacterium]|nr:UDP-N-acetylmuramoyl-L-alanyl-D-glutamate--2,6-diaminopimelate ligase [Thermodesulfobacteriota bacterium]
MILNEILNGIEIREIHGDVGLEISGIALDSQKVGRGYLFAALRGEKQDGHSYIKQALERGAAALLLERFTDDVPEGVTVIEVEDSRVALAGAAANFYGRPARSLTMVGITGTNGKTTITYLLESIWKEGNNNPGVIGTIDYRFSGRRTEAPMTTPESVEIMRLLGEMRDAGVDRVAMEVSSHAIDKERILGCEFDAAVFTNLTQDHLDYHGSMENYRNVKKRLFTELLRDSSKERKYSIINIDDPSGREIADEAAGEVITYSIDDPNADVYAFDHSVTGSGISADVNTPWGRLEVSSRLFGEHNLSNILAAATAALATGSTAREVEGGLSRFAVVPGRLERVENHCGFEVLVDYAHTPDALKNVLAAVRPLTPGRVILVFGCGGDRDRAKRPIMGRIGMELSDVLVITSDNPRTESPERILDDVERGVKEAAGADGKAYSRTEDRRAAIKEAVGIARPGDTVLIAGKGHEDYQIVGTVKHPFDDRKVAAEAIREKSN